jgi:putative sigma-54 modulation protein
MIKKLEIQCDRSVRDPKLRDYISKKIGRLDRYISRRVRESVHAEVHVKANNSKDKNRFMCEVTLHLPHQTVIIKENALNTYAAIDIVEAKLKQQLKKYKDLHGSGKLHRHIIGRFRRKSA